MACVYIKIPRFVFCVSSQHSGRIARRSIITGIKISFASVMHGHRRRCFSTPLARFMRTVAGKIRGIRGQVIGIVFFAAAALGAFPVSILRPPRLVLRLTSLEAFFPPSFKNLSLNLVLSLQSLRLSPSKRLLHPAYIGYSLLTIVF